MSTAENLALLFQHFVLPWTLFSLPLVAAALVIGFMVWMHNTDQGA